MLDLEWLGPKTALGSLQVFLGVVGLLLVAHSRHLLISRIGWSHRLLGTLHLAWLVVGAMGLLISLDDSPWLMTPAGAWTYDGILGILGMAATASAARDFPHRHVANAAGQSGTLHQRAIVTQGEMMEHLFYQGLNLFQAMYLHVVASFSSASAATRMGLLWLVTCPWHVRRFFPVHSFSHNWKVYQSDKNNEKEQEVYLYHIKKWQYIFYKHVILHGVNITVAIHPTSIVPHSLAWRVFWLFLNTSYVMEFFLQTLVKRNVISQPIMLVLQRWLMVGASASALSILPLVSWPVCIASVVGNFVHRHHDVINTLGIAFVHYWLGTSMLQSK